LRGRNNLKRVTNYSQLKLLACKFVMVHFMQDDLPAHFDSLSTAVLTSS
jgi:hypothetical protein